MMAKPNTLSAKQQLDRRLDQALRDSFPASDPISISVERPAAPQPAARPKDTSS
jgi:hypothetical protein